MEHVTKQKAPRNVKKLISRYCRACPLTFGHFQIDPGMCSKKLLLLLLLLTPKLLLAACTQTKNQLCRRFAWYGQICVCQSPRLGPNRGQMDITKTCYMHQGRRLTTRPPT